MSEAVRLRSTDSAFYTPVQVAKLLHWNPQYIRVVARSSPEKLPFPVLVHKGRTQIPAGTFWLWWDSVVGG